MDLIFARSLKLRPDRNKTKNSPINKPVILGIGELNAICQASMWLNIFIWQILEKPPKKGQLVIFPSCIAIPACAPKTIIKKKNAMATISKYAANVFMQIYCHKLEIGAMPV